MTDTNLFDRCGGTRKMADLLEEKPSTVQSWKVAGRIPAGKQREVLKKLSDAGIAIGLEDLIWPLGRQSEDAAEPADEAEAA
jgi:hypothetical protein